MSNPQSTDRLTPEQKRLRAWLNAIMVTRRLSSYDVADVLGVKHATVRMYRAGLRPLTPAAAETLRAWYESPNGVVPQRLSRARAQ